MPLSIRAARIFGMRRLNASTAMGEGDVDAPTISSTSPTDNATSIAVDAVIEITFSENIYFSPSSTITLRHKPSASFANRETFSTTTLAGDAGGSMAIVGNVLTVTPGLDMTGGVEFALRIASDAIKDAADNFFAGIANDTTLSWTIVTGASLDVTKGAQSVNYGTTFDYYVRASGGSDGNAGTSYGAAWATIQHALDTLKTATGDITVGVEGLTAERIDVGAGYDAASTYTSLKFYCYGTAAENEGGITGQDALTGWTQCTAGDTILDGLADKTVAYKKTFTPATNSGLASLLFLATNLMEAGVQCRQARDEIAASIYPVFLRDKENTYRTCDSVGVDGSNFVTTIVDADLIGQQQAAVEASQVIYHATPNVLALADVVSFNSTTGTITITGASQPPDADNPTDPLRYMIVNAPHKITAAGDYAVVDAGGGQVTVYFYPTNAANLENGQVGYAARQWCMILRDASNIEFYGLTFTGCGPDNTVRRAMVMNGNGNGDGPFGSNIKFKNTWLTNSAGHDNGWGGIVLGGTDWVCEYFTSERHLQGAGFAFHPTTRGRYGYGSVSKVEQGQFQAIAPGSSVGMVYHVDIAEDCGVDPHSNKSNIYGTTGNAGWDGFLQWGVGWAYGVRGYVTWQRSVGLVYGCCELSSDLIDTRALDNQSSSDEPVSGTKNLIIMTTLGPNADQTSGTNMDLAEVNSSGANDELTCSVFVGAAISDADNYVDSGGNLYFGSNPDPQITDIKTTVGAIWSDVTTRALVADGPGYAASGLDKTSERTSLISRFDGATDDSGNIIIDYDILGNAIDWENCPRGARVLTPVALTPATVVTGTPSVISATSASVSVSTTTTTGGGIYVVTQPTSITTAPSAAQIMAGNMQTDAAAAYSRTINMLVDGSSPYTVTATGLTTVEYKFHAVEVAPDGTVGTVVSSAAFTPSAVENGDWQQFPGTGSPLLTSPANLPAGEMKKITVVFTYKPEESANVRPMTVHNSSTLCPFYALRYTSGNMDLRFYDSSTNLLANPSASGTITNNTKFAIMASIDTTTGVAQYTADIVNLDTGAHVTGYPTSGAVTADATMVGNAIALISPGSYRGTSQWIAGEMERAVVYIDDYIDFTNATNYQAVVGSDLQTLQDLSVLNALMSVTPNVAQRGTDFQGTPTNDGNGGAMTYSGTGSISTAV